MKRTICLFLIWALMLCLGAGAFASGEPSGSGEASGEASGAAAPSDFDALETVEAEPWMEVSDERVGLEGPAFDEDGNFYVCSTGLSYPINYILRIDGKRDITTIYEGELSPLGLAFDEDGWLFAVCREGQILRMDRDGGNMTSVTPTFEGKTLSLNDLAFLSNGDLLVTDWQGSVADPTGGIYLLTKESGYEEAFVVLGELEGPNGIALSPDESVLWAGITHEGTIYRIELIPDGAGHVTAGDVRVIFENSGSGEPDSNKTDAAGNFYQAMIQAGKILVFSAEGEPLLTVAIPADRSGLRMTSNLAIKPGTREAYMLAAGFGQGSWIYTFEALAEAK